MRNLNMDRWPNFFVVGAPRSGSTTLYDYLKRAEEVYMSPIKEPRYFSSIDPSTMYPPPITDKKKYLALFKGVKDEKAIGEASPSYLRDEKAPYNIKKIIPDAKIIMILRDPLNRAYSQYQLRISNGKTYTFSECIKLSLEPDADDFKSRITKSGFYAKQVKRYQNVFGTDNVKILIFEEFIKDPEPQIKKILEFLGVDSDSPPTIELTHNYLAEPRGRISAALLTNPTLRKIGRHMPQSAAEFTVKKVLGKKASRQVILEHDRRFLENLFRDDSKELEKILGRNLPWPLVKN